MVAVEVVVALDSLFPVVRFCLFVRSFVLSSLVACSWMSLAVVQLLLNQQPNED